jgi:hypothetical protein
MSQASCLRFLQNARYHRFEKIGKDITRCPPLYYMDARRFLLAWLPTGAWMAVILNYSLLSQVPSPGGFDISYLHVPAYFVLAALFLRLFSQHGVARRFWAAISASVSYGLAMELMQPMFNSRTFSISDIALNIAGSCLVLAFITRRGERALRLLTEY